MRGWRTSSDKLKRNLSRHLHPLLELHDGKPDRERTVLPRQLLHVHRVRRGRNTQQHPIRPAQRSVLWRPPQTLKQRLVSHMQTRQPDFSHRLHRQRCRIGHERGYEFEIIRRRSFDDCPINCRVTFYRWVLQDFRERKVIGRTSTRTTLQKTHGSGRLWFLYDISNDAAHCRPDFLRLGRKPERIEPRRAGFRFRLLQGRSGDRCWVRGRRGRGWASLNVWSKVRAHRRAAGVDLIIRRRFVQQLGIILRLLLPNDHLNRGVDVVN